MTKITTLLFALTVQVAVSANANDSLRHCYQQLDIANSGIQTLKTENRELKAKIRTLNKTIDTQKTETDSLKGELTAAKNDITALADSLNVNISNTRSELQANSNTLNQTIREKSQTGLWIIIVIALIFIILAFIFGKAIAKRKNEVENLSAKADKLNEEIVYRLSTEMNDIQVISKQIGALVSAPGVNTESEQKLITTLADRITFMEMTLYKMDNSVRGHKQLSKSIKQSNLSSSISFHKGDFTTMLTLDKIYHAAYVLKPVARKTDVIYAAKLSQGYDLYLKTENLQLTGSFKLRGAYYKISQLNEEQRKAGIIACSAGNHAQGVALAASRMGIKAIVCMPDGAPISKVEATKALGAEVCLVKGAYDDAYNYACQLQQETGMTFIHPFNDEEVIAGQGTIGLEILDQLPDVDAVVCSIGGGGLISGVACAIKSLNPKVKVYGVQAENAPSMKPEKPSRLTVYAHSPTASRSSTPAISRLTWCASTLTRLSRSARTKSPRRFWR